MRAWVAGRPGPPDVLELIDVPDPVAASGQVLIDIRAFGLNRAEVVTRRGGSGSAVKFPRVLGIECVGTVIDAPGSDLAPGQTVAAVMNGMGRAYDGSYAERTVVPRGAVIPLDTRLEWGELAAIPESFLTAWGCLYRGVRMSTDVPPRIVMRPAASALGRAVNQLVTRVGGSVIGITRSARKVGTLREAGFAHVIVGSASVADQVRALWPGGATGIIETVTSSANVSDDLEMRAKGGRLCIAGSLAASDGAGGAPGLSVALAMLRPSVSSFSSESVNAENSSAALQQIVASVESGELDAGVDTRVGFSELVDAHRSMEANAHCGKIVVVREG